MVLAELRPLRGENPLHEGRGVPVFETPFGKLGVQICYDLFFRSLRRSPASRARTSSVNISASPITARALFERIIAARATENAVFFSYVNRVGTDLGLVFAGGSALIGPRGQVIQELPLVREGLIDQEVDLSDTDFARPFRPTLRDSRAEVFDEAAELLREGLRRETEDTGHYKPGVVMAKESEDDKFQLRQIRGMKDRRYQLPGEYPMILHVDRAVAAVSARLRSPMSGLA